MKTNNVLFIRTPLLSIYNICPHHKKENTNKEGIIVHYENTPIKIH